MELIYINLLTECVVFARSVFSSCAVRFKEEIQLNPSEASIQNQTLDEARFHEIINESSQHFDRLIDEYTQAIINEIQRLRIKDAVQELQARVNALKSLLSYHEMSPNVATQLVITALNPLHVSLEVVKLKLEDIENQSRGQEVWVFCRIVGISVLIAGYKFLGQDMPALQRELEEEIRAMHREILDDIASIASKGDIPWEDVPHLLSLDGIEDLAKLYTLLKAGSARELGSVLDTKKINLPVTINSGRPDTLEILSATYGSSGKIKKDVTSILKSKASKKGDFIFLVTNEACGGDPCPGSRKQLEVSYLWAGEKQTQVAIEGSTLYLPHKVIPF